MLGLSGTMGVIVGALLLVERLLGRGLESRTGWATSGNDEVVTMLGLSSLSTTTWESICCDSSLVSRLSILSSSSLLSSSYSIVHASTSGS